MADWAKFSGMVAVLVIAVVGSLLWALNYPSRTIEWSCKPQYETNHPGNKSISSVLCSPLKQLSESSGHAKDNADEIKITDKLLALFNGLLVLVGFLQAYWLYDTGVSTRRLQELFLAVGSAMPMIVGLKLVQYTQIPGENVVADPLPPGPIQPNCRILFCVENKGRSPSRMTDLCIEKCAGLTLPEEATYSHVIPWPLVLEKGPLWIRGDDQHIVVTPADLAALAAHGNQGAFWVYGYFFYRNLLNERLRHGFLFRWDHTIGFVPENRPGYA